MKTCYDIVKTMVITEKGAILNDQRKYLFQVDQVSNKVEIKNAIEEIYKVKVQSVNTSIVRGKLKRVRREQGSTSAWKKAVVTLKPGEKIEVA